MDEAQLCGSSLPTGPIALPALGRSQPGLKNPTWLWWVSNPRSSNPQSDALTHCTMGAGWSFHFYQQSMCSSSVWFPFHFFNQTLWFFYPTCLTKSSTSHTLPGILVFPWRNCWWPQGRKLWGDGDRTHWQCPPAQHQAKVTRYPLGRLCPVLGILAPWLSNSRKRKRSNGYSISKR